MSPPTTGDATRRNLALGAMLAALLAVPTLLGFAVADAGASRPPPPGQETDASTTRPTDLPDIDQYEYVSDAPLTNAPNTAEDALTPQGEEALGIPRITFVSDATGRVRVDNGGRVSLAGGYEIGVTVDPFPPTDFNLDLTLEVLRDGQPVTGATIDTVWDMTIMSHGPFESRLEAAAAGTYESSFYFFMFGHWYVDTTVSLPGSEPLEFRLSIYVWPA